MARKWMTSALRCPQPGCPGPVEADSDTPNEAEREAIKRAVLRVVDRVAAERQAERWRLHDQRAQIARTFKRVETAARRKAGSA